MPHLYPHKQKGWRILYRVYLLDGSRRDKARYRKKKAEALLILSDVERLETLSRRRAMTKEEVIYCINSGYITETEGEELTGVRISTVSTWRPIMIKYEQWSRSHCRAVTHKINTGRLSNVIDRLPDDPGKVTKETINDYITSRQHGGTKSATINKELVIIRKLLDYINKEDNPARDSTLLKISDEKLPRALAPDEIQRFLAALDERKHLLHGYIKPLVITYLYAGLRPSEMIRLTPDDIDWQAEKIIIQGGTKTGKARSVDMHPEVKTTLKDLTGPNLFGGKKRLETKSITRAIKAVMMSAGINNTVPYALRHSFVSYLLASGATLKEVMDMAGHTKLQTTARYLHTIPNPKSPVKRLDFQLNKGPDNTN